MSKKTIQKEIKKITQKIVENYKPEKVILFGSFAWGKFTPDSDVDFFIVKKTKKSKLERIYEVDKFLFDRDIPIDILVYTPKEVEERLELGDFFVEDIIKKGRLIYERKKLRKLLNTPKN